MTDTQKTAAPGASACAGNVLRFSEDDQRWLAARAIDYVLARIRDSKRIRYLMGAGTETFDRLCAAKGAFDGLPADVIAHRYIPESGHFVTSIEDQLEERKR